MTDFKAESKQALRQRAEEKLKATAAATPTALSLDEAKVLLHELQVHQIELEMQNEHLRKTQEDLEVSRERFAHLYDFAPIGLFTISDKGLILDVNLTAARLFGVARSVLANRLFTSFILPEGQDIYYHHHRNLLATGEPQVCEIRLLQSDNQLFWARLEATAIQDESDTLACHVVLSDITDRKSAEDALQQSQALYHDLVETSQDLIWQCDASGRYIYLNPAWEQVFGYKVEEMLGKSFSEFQAPEYAERDSKEFARLLQGNAVKKLETMHIGMDGREIHLVFNAKIIFDERGNPQGTSGTAYDITERKRVEETLKEKEELFRNMFEHHSAVKLIIDPINGDIIDANLAAAEFYGWTREQLMQMKIHDLNTLSFEEMKLELEKASFLQRIHFEFRHRRADGSVRDVEVFTSKINVHGKSLLHSIIHDITERKQIENELQENEKKFRLTFDSSPDAIIINRLNDGVWIDVNEGFTRSTGFTRDDAIGKTSLEMDLWHDSADREKLFQGVKEKGFFENLEARFRKKDGSLVTGLISARFIDLKGVPHMITITRDITAHKQLQQEQLKIEKLESLGTLAGGIAHDFNNILTGILGNISFATIFLDQDHKAYKPLIEAEKASKRAGELAHQLLTFARGGEPIKKVVSPSSIVREAMSLVLSGSNVNGTIQIPESIHAFDVDVGQISQVFHNIIINAMQAMPGGGTLIVSACNKSLSGKNVFSLPPGSYICLMFTDHGCGISEENLKKIFEPYFTLKASGHGLGLASARSIINRHGGHISVSSVVGKGTTFTVYLPSIDQAHTDDQKELTTKAISRHSAGSILVMDDDPLIRDIASEMLTYFGYEVTTCIDGEEAIKLYKASIQSERPFLMCIMDLTIPGGLGGKEAAEQILSAFPEACLVVSSGYSNDHIMANYRRYGFNGAITKPYSISELQKVISSISNP